VEAMQENLTWVQCDKCEKWRMLPADVSEEDLPEKWLCHMNKFDVRNNTCKAPERDQLWYERQFNTDTAVSESQSPIKCMASDPIDSSSSEGAKQKLVSNDVILEHLLDVTERQKKTTMVSKFYFHEALLESTKDSKEEIEGLREAIEAEKTTMPSSTQGTSPIDSAQAKKSSSKAKASSKTSSSPKEKSVSATTTSMAAIDNVETAVKQKSPDTSEVALEKAKASPPKEVALEKAKATPPTEVALEKAKATPSKRAALKQKTLDASEVAVAKPTVTSSKHTPSKQSRSAQSSPRRSLRHRGSPNTSKERSSPETDRGLKRGLSPDPSLVASEKNESTPSKKEGRWSDSSEHPGSPSMLKQRNINELLDKDSPAADTSERGTVEKKAKKPRSIFKKDGKKDTCSGRAKKTASVSKQDSEAKQPKS
jgi:hypothetical protein